VQAAGDSVVVANKNKKGEKQQNFMKERRRYEKAALQWYAAFWRQAASAAAQRVNGIPTASTVTRRSMASRRTFGGVAGGAQVNWCSSRQKPQQCFTSRRLCVPHAA